MNNITPFLNNRINSRQNVANQNNGALNYNVRFGNGQNYDSFESSSSNKETKSFWQKWKGIIIGGAGLLCVSILGVIGYNKGWFKKAGDKIKEITGKTSSKAASNAQENVQSLGKYLETLGLTNKKIDDGTKIKDLLTTPTKKITQRQFFNVARKVNKDLNLSDSTKTQAAVIILEQLRKNLANDVNIDNFNKDTEINNTNLQEILKNILKAEEKEIRNKLDGSKDLQEKWQEFTESKEEEKSSKVNNVADALDSAIHDEVINQEHKELVQDILSNLKEYITPDNADAVADALGWAIDKEIINQEHKELVQGILSKLNEKGVITEDNTGDVARVLDNAINKGIINQEDEHKELVQGILTQLQDKTKYNEYAVTILLITAKANGVVNDDTTYNNMINSCISTNTGDVADALGWAIHEGIIKQEHKELVQDILSNLKEYITPDNTNAVARVLGWAIQSGSINNQNDNGLVQGILSKLNEKGVITEDNTGAVADALGWAIQYGVIKNENQDHKLLVQDIISKFNNQEVITSYNTDAVARVLITAKAKGFVNDDTTYNDMIQRCIKANTGDVAMVLITAKANGVVNDDTTYNVMIQRCIKANTGDVARVLITAKAKGFVNDDTTYNDMIQRCISTNTGAVADALGWAIQSGSINNQNDNGLVQGIISKFNNQEVITPDNTDAVARALDSAIQGDFINDDDNGLVQGIISKFNNQEVITPGSTYAVARVLGLAINKGIINQEDEHKELVQGILSKLNEKGVITEDNTGAVADALGWAIHKGIINKDEHKQLVQDIIKRLKSSITDTTCFNLKELINLATDKGFINDDDIEKMQQE